MWRRSGGEGHGCRLGIRCHGQADVGEKLAGAGGESEMSIEIEILSGDASWPAAAPLFNAIWPPEVVATRPWANIVSAHAELRVLVQDETGPVCHVGIHRRQATWNG